MGSTSYLSDVGGVWGARTRGLAARSRATELVADLSHTNPHSGCVVLHYYLLAYVTLRRGS